MSARRRQQRGQVIVLTALVVTTVLGALLAAVGGLLVLSSESSRADSAAYLGAQSGAESVDPGVFASGVSATSQVRLGPAAVANCERAVTVADPGATVSCVVSGGSITVTVTKSVRMPVPFFAVTETVRSVHTASAVLGTVHPY